MSSSNRKDSLKEARTKHKKVKTATPTHSTTIFTKLPSSILERGVIPFLSKKDMASLAETSSEHKKLSQETLAVRELLDLVVKGKKQEAAKILEKNPELLFKRGFITDCSNRTFENVSAFEYALWAYDSPMWSMMMSFIEKMNKGKETAAFQLKKLEDEGIEYTLVRIKDVSRTSKLVNKKGKTSTKEEAKATEVTEKIRESHYDYKLLDVLKQHNQFLQDELEFYNSPEINVDVINQDWVQNVGGAQRLMPMNVIKEICDKNFLKKDFAKEKIGYETKMDADETKRNNLEVFTIDQEPATSSPKIGKKIPLYPLSSSSGLGIDFAIYNFREATVIAKADPYNTYLPSLGMNIEHDSNHKAIKSLSENRIKQFLELKEYLLPSPELTRSKMEI